MTMKFKVTLVYSDGEMIDYIDTCSANADAALARADYQHGDYASTIIVELVESNS